MNLTQKVARRLKDTVVTACYTVPNPFWPSVEAGSRVSQWVESLRRDGIVRIDKPEFAKVVEGLEKAYFGLLDRRPAPERLTDTELGDSELFAQRQRTEFAEALEASKGGGEYLYYVSVKDPWVGKVLLDEEIVGTLYNYYGRQPYYRNQPFLSNVEITQECRIQISPALFHVDHLRQVTGMLLVSDTTEETTHMQYVERSHDRRFWKKPYLSERECEEWARRGRIRPLVGKAGTFYLFDAGGIHRRVHHPGTARRILHFNVSTGHLQRKCMERFEGWRPLKEYPVHIQRTLARF